MSGVFLLLADMACLMKFKYAGVIYVLLCNYVSFSNLNPFVVFDYRLLIAAFIFNFFYSGFGIAESYFGAEMLVLLSFMRCYSLSIIRKRGIRSNLYILCALFILFRSFMIVHIKDNLVMAICASVCVAYRIYNFLIENKDIKIPIAAYLCTYPSLVIINLMYGLDALLIIDGDLDWVAIMQLRYLLSTIFAEILIAADGIKYRRFSYASVAVILLCLKTQADIELIFFSSFFLYATRYILINTCSAAIVSLHLFLIFASKMFINFGIITYKGQNISKFSNEVAWISAYAIGAILCYLIYHFIFKPTKRRKLSIKEGLSKFQADSRPGHIVEENNLGCEDIICELPRNS